MPCFAILTDGSERKSTFDEKNRLARALYLEQLHLVKKVEARNDIDIILLKKNDTFFPSSPLPKISSNKVILMLAEEDWLLVSLKCIDISSMNSLR